MVQGKTVQLIVSKPIEDSWDDIYDIVNDSGFEVVDSCFDGVGTAKLTLVKYSRLTIDGVDLSELCGNLTVCGCIVTQ